MSNQGSTSPNSNVRCSMMLAPRPRTFSTRASVPRRLRFYLGLSSRQFCHCRGRNNNSATTCPRCSCPTSGQRYHGHLESFRKIFDTYNVAALLLLRRIKLSLPTADTAQLRHPVLGLANLTSLEIMNHLRLQYGLFRVTDFNILYLKLEETMGCESQFADFASRFRLIFAQFASNNQPISELQQCNFLCRSIASHADLVEAQDTFFNLFPDPNTRTFLALVAHITNPNISAHAGIHGGCIYLSPASIKNLDFAMF